MKKLFIQKIMAVALISLFLNARSYTGSTMVSGTTPSFDVYYRISPVTAGIRRISYNDSKENITYSQDAADFTFGFKKITVTTDSFHAMLSLVVDNPTSHPVSFRIEILSVGPDIVSRDITVEPMSGPAFASIQHTIRFRD